MREIPETESGACGSVREMKKNNTEKLKWRVADFAAGMKKEFPIRLFRTGTVLLLLLLLFLAGRGQERIPGKESLGGGEDGGRIQRSGFESACAGKKIPEPVLEEVPFGALYGLEEYDIPEKQLDFDTLRREENPHIYAWITIPDTQIDYPVLQHPEKTDYYLNHNIDGKEGYPGCIYTQNYNSKDWSDRQTVLYGHNMRNGTMFSGLHAYEDETFFKENPYFYIYVEDTVLVYRVFAAYPFSDDHLLMSYDTETEAGYQEYLREIRRAAEAGGHYDEAAAPDPQDRIVTLSTCIAQRPEQRYLVQGVLETEGSAAASGTAAFPDTAGAENDA